MGKLKHSKEQADFGNVLEARYGLKIPYDLKNNSAWLLRFIELFSYDPHLPKEEADKTGWRVVQTIKDDYKFDTPIDHTARKLELHENDIRFITDLLVNHSITPIEKECINEEYIDLIAFEAEENQAYYD